MSGAALLTVSVRAAVRATAPVPRLRAWVPLKMATPLRLIAGLDERVMAESDWLSMATLEPTGGERLSAVAPLMAPALFR